ncbi:MAG: RepB family plasmid replication initiator protein [Lactococcus lactis]|uniref:Protein involved in initiation of plasmid replication n=1 Tax=Alkalibacterium gilvum TaxID=1130080 RepID=A0A1H6VU73_9LACT|nr:replication initiation protein [Alkalibacterium gilvum]MDN6731524.1 replication initiation protein [Atopostipes suicloacalis]SEJ06644.1 Protein involved in initiation of plasmid replication [Alkalibacterium gilvum]
MTEVVKYHNDLNTVVMRNWKPIEMNIFFGIIAKARDKDTRKLIFSTDELREMTDTAGNKNVSRWNKAMIDVSQKVSQLSYYYEDEERYVLMMLFSMFEVNKKDQTLTIQVSEYFDYVLNQLNATFTSYELREFTELRSSYSKSMYRLLKQWRTVGKKRFSVDEFSMLLDVPKSYSKGMIDRQIISPIIEELSKFFDNLKVKKIKHNTRGNPITHYEFTWKPEKTEKWVENKYNKKSVSSSKTVRNETLPEWAKDNYESKPDELLPPEKQARFLTKLEQIRNNKKT